MFTKTINGAHYRELCMKDYITLLKSCMDDNETFFFNTFNVLSKCCSFTVGELKNLDVISFLLVCIQIRELSMGGVINIEFPDEDNIDNVRAEITTALIILIKMPRP
jgi:hypothetical protein